jgi:hypothetical protein
MQFLNVYPKRIFATLNADGIFEGHIFFNLEQYGLLLSDTVTDITISEDPLMVGQWKIWVKPMFEVNMPHFDQFVETLNHYVFDVLQFMPNRRQQGKDLPVVKLFFNDIYFDMSGTKPVVQKIPGYAVKK